MVASNAAEIQTPLELEVQSTLLVAIQANAERAGKERTSHDDAWSYAHAAKDLAEALAALRG